MKPGRKLSTPELKALANTINVTRDANTVILSPVMKDAPMMPDWLPDAAREVWHHDVARVIATGATSVDSEMFALYCVTMSDFIASVRAGQPANAAFRSELRKQMELLGIAGAKSRLAKIGGMEPKPGNPFSVRPSIK